MEPACNFKPNHSRTQPASNLLSVLLCRAVDAGTQQMQMLYQIRGATLSVRSKDAAATVKVCRDDETCSPSAACQLVQCHIYFCLTGATAECKTVDRLDLGHDP